MIKVGYLVSYDYEWIYPSIELLYPYVSKIYLAIDQDYLTWSGNPIAINKDFFDKIKTLDNKDKIEFYYDRFYVPTISPMECEIRERSAGSFTNSKPLLFNVKSSISAST